MVTIKILLLLLFCQQIKSQYVTVLSTLDLRKLNLKLDDYNFYNLELMGTGYQKTISYKNILFNPSNNYSIYDNLNIKRIGKYVSCYEILPRMSVDNKYLYINFPFYLNALVSSDNDFYQVKTRALYNILFYRESFSNEGDGFSIIDPIDDDKGCKFKLRFVQSPEIYGNYRINSDVMGYVGLINSSYVGVVKNITESMELRWTGELLYSELHEKYIIPEDVEKKKILTLNANPTGLFQINYRSSGYYSGGISEIISGSQLYVTNYTLSETVTTRAQKLFLTDISSVLNLNAVKSNSYIPSPSSLLFAALMLFIICY